MAGHDDGLGAGEGPQAGQAGQGGGRSFSTCSWCHEAVAAGERHCLCGHMTGPRMRCRCAKCLGGVPPEGLTAEDIDAVIGRLGRRAADE